LEHEVASDDRRLARIVRRCQQLPGQLLFQYLDDEGNQHTVGSEEVNAYLREITGEDITAKDFRTWAGTQLAAAALRAFRNLDSESKRKNAIVRAVEKVARHLGNTPAICRRCYIHPAIFDGYVDGTLLEALAAATTTYLKENIENDECRGGGGYRVLRLRLGARDHGAK
jgi:DNA topoisomerase-1